MTSRSLQGSVGVEESNVAASMAAKTEEETSAASVLAGLQMAVQQPAAVSDAEQPKNDEEAEAAMIDMLFGAGATSSTPQDRELGRQQPGERSRSRSPAACCS